MDVDMKARWAPEVRMCGARLPGTGITCHLRAHDTHEHVGEDGLGGEWAWDDRRNCGAHLCDDKCKGGHHGV